MPSHYETLGVPQDATSEQIAEAYRRLAKQCHPDLHPGDAEAEDRFKKLNAANHTLSDNDKRAEYDEAGILGDDHADILQMFMAGFAQAVGRCMAFQQRTGTLQDPFDVLRAEIASSKQAAFQALSHLEAQHRELARLRSRLMKAGNPVSDNNPLAKHVDRQLAGMIGEKLALQTAIERAEKVSSLAETYSLHPEEDAGAVRSKSMRLPRYTGVFMPGGI